MAQFSKNNDFLNDPQNRDSVESTVQLIQRRTEDGNQNKSMMSKLFNLSVIILYVLMAGLIIFLILDHQYSHSKIDSMENEIVNLLKDSGALKSKNTKLEAMDNEMMDLKQKFDLLKDKDAQILQTLAQKEVETLKEFNKILMELVPKGSAQKLQIQDLEHDIEESIQDTDQIGLRENNSIGIINYNISSLYNSTLKLGQEFSDISKKYGEKINWESQIHELTNESKKLLELFMGISDKVLRINCWDYKKHGLSVSGFYDIDPDGKGVGLEPFQVYCNFENGEAATILYPNDPSSASVLPCAEDNCFSHNFTYNATKNQIESLKYSSESCIQEITFECYLAHLEGQGSWIDHHGNRQIYFTGSDPGNYMCSCGTNNSCKTLGNHKVACNCDSSSFPEWQTDQGYISNKSALPISSFQYGHLLGGGTQQAKIKVGGLKCTGKSLIRDSYCSNLKLQGTIMSGYYVFTDHSSTDQYFIQYCNMSKPMGHEDQGQKFNLLTSDSIQSKIKELNEFKDDFSSKVENLMKPNTDAIKKMKNRIGKLMGLTSDRCRTEKTRWGPKEFWCDNKLCIDEALTCNGLNDCFDNSDEAYC